MRRSLALGVTGLAQRASQPPVVALSPRTGPERLARHLLDNAGATVNHLASLADDEAWLGMTHLALIKRKARPTPGQITDLAAPPQHESGRIHAPAFRCTTRVLGCYDAFSSQRREFAPSHTAPHSFYSAVACCWVCMHLAFFLVTHG